jgi:hypothetical protein
LLDIDDPPKADGVDGCNHRSRRRHPKVRRTTVLARRARAVSVG